MLKLFYTSIIGYFIIQPLRILLSFFKVFIGKGSINNIFTKLEHWIHVSRPHFFKTLYLNLRSEPLSIAIKCPIWVYGKVAICAADGAIEFDCKSVYSGMVHLGRYDLHRSKDVTKFYNHGKIILKGWGRILRGAELMIFKDAELILGNDFFIGENAMITCQKKISLGSSCRLVYNSQILDTDLHYSINNTTGEVRPKYRPVIIGDYNWIGNNCTIKKGVKTPNHTTVAGSYTVLTKDYTKDTPEYSILGGTPAKVIVSGYSRIWNHEHQRVMYLDKWFKEHPTESKYIYDVENHSLTEYTEN